MWTYSQLTGKLEHNGEAYAVGYSGHQEGRNNPYLDWEPNVGPIPDGIYRIGDPAYVDQSGPHGPYVLPLTPDPSNDMYGRSGFLIHGDSIESPGSASHGCIILSRPIREQIAASGDRELQVIST